MTLAIIAVGLIIISTALGARHYRNAAIAVAVAAVAVGIAATIVAIA